MTSSLSPHISSNSVKRELPFAAPPSPPAVAAVRIAPGPDRVGHPTPSTRRRRPPARWPGRIGRCRRAIRPGTVGRSGADGCRGNGLADAWLGSRHLRGGGAGQDSGGARPVRPGRAAQDRACRDSPGADRRGGCLGLRRSCRVRCAARRRLDAITSDIRFADLRSCAADARCSDRRPDRRRPNRRRGRAAGHGGSRGAVPGRRGRVASPRLARAAAGVHSGCRRRLARTAGHTVGIRTAGDHTGCHPAAPNCAVSGHTTRNQRPGADNNTARRHTSQRHSARRRAAPRVAAHRDAAHRGTDAAHRDTHTAHRGTGTTYRGAAPGAAGPDRDRPTRRFALGTGGP